MLKPTLGRVLTALCAGVLLLLMAAWLGPPHQICEPAQAGQEHCTSYNLALFILLEIAEFIDNHNGVITALATIAIAGFTWTLWQSSEKMWRVTRVSTLAARRAANAAIRSATLAEQNLIATQRAWIKIDQITVSQPLIFTEINASTSISIRITNVGNAPALHVHPHAWLYALRQGGSPIEEQRRLCDEIKRSPPPQFGLGAIFPAETFPDNVKFGSWGFGISISREAIAQGIAISATGRILALYVFGCIDYNFPADLRNHHQTRFIFTLNKREAAPISPDDGTVPLNNLWLVHTGFTGGNDAD